MTSDKIQGLRDALTSCRFGDELLHFQDCSNNDTLYDKRDPTEAVILCYGDDGLESDRARALRDLLVALPGLLDIAERHAEGW